MIIKVIFLLFYIHIVNASIRDPDVFSYYYYKKLNYENITECDEVLGRFAKSTSNFNECAVNYSRPIRMCEKCVDDYSETLKSYQSILSTDVNGTHCRDVLLNLDRLQIVETTFNNIKNLWGRAYCDKCFVWNDGTPTLSNDTQNFIDHFTDTKACITKHFNHDRIPNNTEVICKDCMDKYVELNNLYESLKGPSEISKICMDIVDSMNATRAIWSDVLDCCRLRRTPEVYFFVSTALIALTPAIFYLLAKIFCEGSKVGTFEYRVNGQSRYVASFRGDPSTSN